MNAVTINEDASSKSVDIDHVDGAGHDAMILPHDDAGCDSDMDMISSVEYGRMDVC